MSSTKVKHEEMFHYFSRFKHEPTDEGRRQWFNHQSHGVRPSTPDPFFLTLEDGKFGVDLITSEYRQMFLKGGVEWWGLYQIWKDWKGHRIWLKILLGWYKQPPDWLFNEDDEAVEALLVPLVDKEAT